MKFSKDESQVNTQTIVEFILEKFHNWGIRSIFTVPGAHVDELLTLIVRDGRFKVVVASHEQGAGYMADGYSRISSGPSAVITINGPGASNLTTSAVTARIEHSPILFLTGDVPLSIQGLGGFQSSDPESSNSLAIFKESVYNSMSISESNQIVNIFQDFENSFKYKVPSPLHINIPCDLLLKHVENVSDFTDFHNEDIETDEKISMFPQTPILPGTRVIMLVGEEIKSKEDMMEIAKFCKNFSIPVASTLSSKNLQALLSEELKLGVFGYAGGPRAFEAILDSSVETLIILGAELNERNTYAWHPNFFCKNRKIIKFNYGCGKLKNYRKMVFEIDVDRPVMALEWLQTFWSEALKKQQALRTSWFYKFKTFPLVPKINSETKFRNNEGMFMSTVVSIMNESLPLDTVLFLDSGDHRIDAGFFWEPREQGGFYTAAQTAPMGWAICAAIGASEAIDNAPICVLTGDGCMQMHGMEIAVAARYKSRVIFLVSNNSSYGRIAVRFKNESEDIRNIITALPSISWVDFARSLGVESMKASNPNELRVALNKAMDIDGPFLIEMITILEEECSFPKAIFSSTIENS